MKKNPALITAGIIFSLVSLAHLLRIISHAEIRVGEAILPMNISYIGFIITLLLALWMFSASRSNQ